jgi:amino acid transporter
MITSAFSAGDSFLFCSSRILYGLAIREQAPSIFTYCPKGLPIVAVLFSVRLDGSLFGPITLALMAEPKECLCLLVFDRSPVRTGVQVNYILLCVEYPADVIPSWFAQLSTIGGFFGWFSINLTYIFFCGYRISI